MFLVMERRQSEANYWQIYVYANQQMATQHQEMDTNIVDEVLFNIQEKII
jgi:hypothetical protein